MSVQAMTWAFDQDIPPKPKVVLLALANRADPATGKCWPGLERLARESSVPERSLIRHIAALVRNGYVIRERTRDARGRQRNNVYYLLLDRDPAKFGPWKFASGHDESEDDGGDDVSVMEETDPQDVVEPTATMAPGEPVDNCGGPSAKTPRPPTAIGGTHQPSSEPKPETTGSQNRTRRAIGFSRAAQDDDIDRERFAQLAEKAMARVFVLKDSRAWKAWCAYRGQHGQVASLPETWAEVDGKRRCGWYLPTLFPPDHSDATGPPEPA